MNKSKPKWIDIQIKLAGRVIKPITSIDFNLSPPMSNAKKIRTKKQ